MARRVAVALPAMERLSSEAAAAHLAMEKLSSEAAAALLATERQSNEAAAALLAMERPSSEAAAALLATKRPPSEAAVALIAETDLRRRVSAEAVVVRPVGSVAQVLRQKERLAVRVDHPFVKLLPRSLPDVLHASREARVARRAVESRVAVAPQAATSRRRA